MGKEIIIRETDNGWIVEVKYPARSFTEVADDLVSGIDSFTEGLTEISPDALSMGILTTVLSGKVKLAEGRSRALVSHSDEDALSLVKTIMEE